MVREALVTSVTCTPPLGPPVRFHITQVSMFPNARSPASARARAPSTLSRIQRIFGPEKYVASGRPTLARNRSCPPSAENSSTSLSVRVSCHTKALCTASPVARSHTTVVSRWLVMPTAARSDAEIPAFSSPPAITSWVRAHTSAGSCSTQPGFG